MSLHYPVLNAQTEFDTIAGGTHVDTKATTKYPQSSMSGTVIGDNPQRQGGSRQSRPRRVHIRPVVGKLGQHRGAEVRSCATEGGAKTSARTGGAEAARTRQTQTRPQPSSRLLHRRRSRPQHPNRTNPASQTPSAWTFRGRADTHRRTHEFDRQRFALMTRWWSARRRIRMVLAPLEAGDVVLAHRLVGVAPVRI